MNKLKHILPLLLILTGSLVMAQTKQPINPDIIRELTIMGFQDGIVTSVGNDGASLNSAREIVNYKFHKGKYLAGPRLPVRLWNTLDTSTSKDDRIDAIFGYYKGTTKELLTIKRDKNTFAQPGLYQILKLNNGGLPVSELLQVAYNSSANAGSFAFGWNTVHEDSILYIANRNMPLNIYDGNKIYPARPLGPGQPFAVPIGTGSMSGTYKYKYLYVFLLDTGGGNFPYWKTNFSSPSFPVYPNNENVYIEGLLGPLDTVKFAVLLYRTKTDGDTYYVVDTIRGGVQYYTDTLTDAQLGDTANFTWGGGNHNAGIGLSQDRTLSSNPIYLLGTDILEDSTKVDSLFPPGAPFGFLNRGPATVGGNVLRIPNHYMDYIAYQVVFVDSNGFNSYPSPPCFVKDTVYSLSSGITDSLISVSLYNLPLPAQNSNVKYRLLLRRQQSERTYKGVTPSSKQWIKWPGDRDNSVWEHIDKIVILDTLDLITSYSAGSPYIDSVHIDSLLRGKYPAYKGYSDTALDTIEIVASDSSVRYDDDTTLYLPEMLTVNDSSITFNPGDLALFNGKLYATSDPGGLNDVFYSQTGGIGAKIIGQMRWPASHLLQFPTGDGAGFIGIESVENGLYLLKQNSLRSLRGPRFLDYQATQVFDNRGAMAPNATTVSNRTLLFLDERGLLALDLGASSLTPLSTQIQDQFDSLGYNRMKRAVLADLNDLLLLSVPAAANDSVVNNKVFVYDLLTQAWLTYDFGFQSWVQYDTERALGEWRTDRYIFGTDYNRLLKFGYDETDTTDYDTTTIATKVETKFLFDDVPGHKEIYYIDLIGEGKMDSCKITLLKDLNVNLYDTAKTVYQAIDFTVKPRQRVLFNEPVVSAAFRIESFRGNHHILKGYTIGWKPKDNLND